MERRVFSGNILHQGSRASSVIIRLLPAVSPPCIQSAPAPFISRSCRSAASFRSVDLHHRSHLTHLAHNSPTPSQPLSIFWPALHPLHAPASRLLRCPPHYHTQAGLRYFLWANAWCMCMQQAMGHPKAPNRRSRLCSDRAGAVVPCGRDSAASLRSPR
jgi:hypothetical protein